MPSTSQNFLRELVAPPNADVDIVAVHGLNPLNNEIHAEATWTAGDKLWLRDFLPDKIPNARVLLFGYNSNVAFETSTAGVREHANNLLNRLKLKRSQENDKPIIFVCHSFGGIVVKRALVTAQLDKTYESIRSSTYGIAFFGTPHQGGHFAKLGDIAATIARALLRSPRNNVMEALKKDSLFADEVVRDFRYQLEEYSILTFYETRPFQKLGLIVDQKSATLGLPGTRETHIALDADHSHICKFESADGDNYEQVIGNLAELVECARKAFSERDEQQRPAPLRAPDPGSVLEPASSIFMVPYPNNEDFVGRERIMEDLKDRLWSDQESERDGCQARAALFGLGGVGLKTQIAIKFAYWLHKQHPITSVFWVHASSKERFHQALTGVARKCNIPGVDNPNMDTSALVKEWLSSTRSGKWLMILDNADDEEIFFPTCNDNEQGLRSSGEIARAIGLAEYIPEYPRGSILITTRDKKVGNKLVKSRGKGLIEVKKMNDEESRGLLRTKLGEDASLDPEADELASLLEHLPLALVQAASYIQENSLDIASYLELYKASGDAEVELLSEPFETMGRDSKVPNAVVATWMISFDQIRRNCPSAAELLSLMAFLDRQGIPKALLQQQVQKPLDLQTALGTLQAFSLITQVAARHAFDLHRLVQLVIRKWLTIHEGFDLWGVKALTAVSNVMPFDSHEFKNWKECALYLPHARTALQHESQLALQARPRLDLLHRILGYLSAQGQWNDAEITAVQATGMARRLLGNTAEMTLTCIGNLALTHMHQGRLAEAHELFMELMQIQNRTLGTEHPSTMRTMANLALIYRRQGRYVEAEELQRRVCETRGRILGAKHPATLRSVAHLATTLGVMGHWKEEQKLYWRVLDGQKEALGSQHPETILTMLHLAGVYQSLGNMEKAQATAAEAVDLSRNVLGAEHPTTLDNITRLATIFRDYGRLEEAEELCVEVVNTKQRLLGSRHPDVLRDISELATIYHSQGQFQKAEELRMQLFEEHRRMWGIEHPNTILYMGSLALTRASLGQLGQAISLGSEALALRTKVSGAKHPDTILAMAHLADFYYDVGRTDEAIALMRDAAKLFLEALGADHRWTKWALNRLVLWTGAKTSDLSEQLQGLDIKR